MRRKIILALAIGISVCCLIFYFLIHNGDEMRRFKKYEYAFNLVNNAVIQDYTQSNVNSKERQTYFLNFDDNTIYKNFLLENKKVNSMDMDSLDKIQDFYPYPFECIYVTAKQVEYVYAQGFVSVVYVKKGFYPECNILEFDTDIEWLGGNWYSKKISN